MYHRMLRKVTACNNPWNEIEKKKKKSAVSRLPLSMCFYRFVSQIRGTQNACSVSGSNKDTRTALRSQIRIAGSETGSRLQRIPFFIIFRESFHGSMEMEVGIKRGRNRRAGLFPAVVTGYRTRISVILILLESVVFRGGRRGQAISGCGETVAGHNTTCGCSPEC